MVGGWDAILLVSQMGRYPRTGGSLSTLTCSASVVKLLKQLRWCCLEIPNPFRLSFLQETLIGNGESIHLIRDLAYSSPFPEMPVTIADYPFEDRASSYLQARNLNGVLIARNKRQAVAWASRLPHLIHFLPSLAATRVGHTTGCAWGRETLGPTYINSFATSSQKCQPTKKGDHGNPSKDTRIHNLMVWLIVRRLTKVYGKMPFGPTFTTSGSMFSCQIHRISWHGTADENREPTATNPARWYQPLMVKQQYCPPFLTSLLVIIEH